jgi:hypothetical protein
VVTKFAKAVAWVCVLLLNFFFVYFSILRGLQRGLDWQRLYCVACVIQLVAEVLFYETSECAIVNFFIPDLARTEVQGVTYAIHQAIQSMFSSMAETKIPILDAPRYLFLSTRLAERFPDLLESVIVRSYHSYSPGELGRKWKISHGSTFVSSERGEVRVGSRVRRMTFTGVLVGLLQYLGSVSISVQRFFIHALQPVIMAGVAAMISVILSDPWYVLIFVPVLLYGAYRLWDHWHSNEDDDDGSREDAVAPLPPEINSLDSKSDVATKSSPSEDCNSNLHNSSQWEDCDEGSLFESCESSHEGASSSADDNHDQSNFMDDFSLEDEDDDLSFRISAEANSLKGWKPRRRFQSVSSEDVSLDLDLDSYDDNSASMNSRRNAESSQISEELPMK